MEQKYMKDEREPLVPPYEDENSGYLVRGRTIGVVKMDKSDSEYLYDIAQSLRILIQEMSHPIIIANAPYSEGP